MPIAMADFGPGGIDHQQAKQRQANDNADQDPIRTLRGCAQRWFFDALAVWAGYGPGLRKSFHPFSKTLPSLFKIFKFIKTGAARRKQHDIARFDDFCGSLNGRLQARLAG